MEAGTVLLFFMACVGGSLIQSVCGFGYGVFTMMFLPYLMPSTLSAVMVTGLLGMTSSAILSVRYRRHMTWRKIIIPLLAYFLISTFAVRLSISMNEALIKTLLGVMLLALSLYFLRFASKIHIRPTRTNAVVAGSLGGVMSAMFGMGGPPIGAYCLSACDSNEEYIADVQIYTVLSNIYVNIVRTANGLCTSYELTFWAIGAAAVFCGSWLGKGIFSRLDANALRRVVYGFMAISGLILIVKH